MRRISILFALVAMLAGTLTVCSNVAGDRRKAGRTDSNGHVLTNLWKEYDRAADADLPEKEEKILDAIIKEAASKGYAMDLYDGLVKLVNVTRSRNWKQLDDVKKRVTEESEAFGSSVVKYNLALSGFVKDGIGQDWYVENVAGKASGLKRDRHDVFYGRDPRLAGLPSFILGNIANDYEYILWSIAAGGYSFYLRPEVIETARIDLSEYLGDSYPSSAYAEYIGIAADADGTDELRSALESFAEKYKGKAIGLYAVQDLICSRFGDMSDASSDEFVALRKECVEFEKYRSSFSGQESSVAKGCIAVSSLIEILDGNDIRISDEDDTVIVAVRNLKGVDFRLESKERDFVWKVRLENKVRSYYVYDTLKVALPAMDDGEYLVSCSEGDMVKQASFTRMSVAFAIRGKGDDMCVYAADGRTGRPVEKADLTLSYKGEVQKTVKDFRFDGFTPVGKDISDLIAGNSGKTEFRCSYTGPDGFLRKGVSLAVRPGTPSVTYNNDEFKVDADVYLDRAAYNPGDTVRFKTIAFGRWADGRMSVMQDLKGLSVVLNDKDGGKVDAVSLETNEFGSAAGSFVLPESGLSNGRCSISVFYEDRRLATSPFVLDEFVLPTYTVEFNDNMVHWTPGDTVAVKGNVKSWSGHPLSSASVTYTVSYGDFLETGNLVLDDNGDFSVEFVSAMTDPADYKVTVKVVDLTGETKEAFTYARVSTYLYISAEVENEAEGTVDYVQRKDAELPFDWYSSTSIVNDEKVRMKFNVNSVFVPNVPEDVGYTVLKGERVLFSGSTRSGEYFTVDLSGQPSGLYTVKAESSYTDMSGKKVAIGYIKNIVLMDAADRTLYVPGVRSSFMKVEGEKTGVLMGSTDGPVWALADLYDDKGKVLESRRIYLEGQYGREGSLTFVGFEYKPEYSDAVSLRIFYFKDFSSVQYEAEFNRPHPDYDLPLEFISFTDSTYPGAETVFSVKTLPGVECLVSVFDKSTESIMPNVWSKVYRRMPRAVRVPLNYSCGESSVLALYSSEGRYGMSASRKSKDEVIPFQLAETKSSPSGAMGLIAAEDKAENVLFDKGLAEVADAADIRDDFRKTIVFMPFLRSGEDGIIDVSFVPSDKLSTYVVALYAHDSLMRNAQIRRDVTVTMPVKVSVMEPGFLYSGDVYRMKVSVSNISENDLDGVLTLYVYDNEDYKNSRPVSVMSKCLTVSAGKNLSGEFEISVPEGVDVLGFKAVFAAEVDGAGVSDGLFVKVPVKPADQTLVEAHSAVLHSYMDRDSLRTVLAGLFTGTLGQGALYKEISLMDMLMDSVPEKVKASSDDILSLTEAYYVAKMAGSFKEGLSVCPDMQALYEKILDCRNADGGFGWFEGFDSSEIMTAVVLERFAVLASKGLSDVDAEIIRSAVKYLDIRQFGDKRPYWSGSIPLEQYLYVRSMYPEVEFSPDVDRKMLNGFRKSVRDYLLPSKERGLDGYILGKARRAATALNLASAGAGQLAKSYGLSQRRLSGSADADIASLLEYAVEHPSGGVYYPNAVMPFRGLLESEVYAHSLICDLMSRAGTPESRSVADGIRLWIMLQKETQHWDSDHAYVNAVNSVLAGSEAVKSTKIAVMTKKYMKPFSDVQAAGNGFVIEKKYYREYVREEEGKPVGGREELAPGAEVEVGDKIIAEYRIWSAENRSFVKLSAPRYASLRPVNQLSGRTGVWFRPLSGRLSLPGMFVPSGYREVRTDATNWYFDVCPEETTVFEEEFYVTQSGEFTEPAVSIESLYSPHYRSNGGFQGKISVKN